MANSFFFLGGNALVKATVVDSSTPPVPITPDTIAVAVTDPTGTACTVGAPSATTTGMYQAMVALLTVFGAYDVTWTVLADGFTSVIKYIFTVLATAPVAAPADLATFLGTSVDSDRATYLLYSAQALCETVVAPLPAGASAIVCRMAAAAYMNPGGATVSALGSARIEYGASSAVTQVGVMLTAADRRDLRRLAGGGGAFSVDLTPSDALTTLPIWDADPVIVVVSA